MFADLKIRKKLFVRIFSYFLLLIISIFLIVFFMNLYYIDKLENETEKSYLYNLEATSNTIDSNVYEILMSTLLLDASEDFHDIIYATDVIKKVDFQKVSQCASILTDFRASRRMIENAYLVSVKSDLVIGSNGTSRIDEFFEYSSVYSEYDTSFWMDIFETKSVEDYMILKSSYVKNNYSGKQKEVLPIVIKSFGGKNFNQYLVIDISKEAIIEYLENTRLTKNSMILIYDEETNQIIESKEKSNKFSIDEITDLTLNSKSTFSFEKNSESYMVIRYRNDKAKISNFYYLAIVPIEDFNQASREYIWLPAIMILISVILMVVIAYFFTDKIYHPIHDISLLLKYNEKRGAIKDKGEMAFLNNEIRSIIERNNELQSDINVALPYVIERYFSSIMTEQVIIDENKVNSFLLHYDFAFENPCFQVVHIRMHFTDEFYENYSTVDYEKINHNFIDATRDLFKDDVKSYNFAMGKNKICIMLNTSHDYEADLTIKKINTFFENIEIEEKYFYVTCGIGRLYDGLEGLQKSFIEARDSSGELLCSGKYIIQSYKDEKRSSRYEYAIEQEHCLFNLLINGDREGALKYYKEIIDQNKGKGLAHFDEKALFLQIYNTGKRALNAGGKQSYEVLGEDYINIFSSFQDMEVDEIEKYVNMYIDKVILFHENSRVKMVDKQSIVNYIEEKYREDIYLDKIASDLNLPSRNLSKNLKKVLGMPFQRYLSLVRIEQSKKLLKNSSISVKEIADDVGYNSRHTFIRMFKQLEGITPSMYRKNIEKIDKMNK